jgi:hypothetical protein
MVRLFIAVLLAGSLISCTKKVDQVFSFERTDYTGSLLRTDGYYYYQDVQSGYYTLLFFYRNGIMLYGGAVQAPDIPAREQRFANGSWYNTVKGDLSYWGIFRVLGTTIELESRGSDGSTGLLVYRDTGLIENDTTYRITRQRRVNGDNDRVVDKVYHFKPFSPKPDSTNTFIK